MVSRLANSSTDIRYNMVFRWGNFVADIPRRLGHNEALDASVAALLARHSETSRRQDQSDPRAESVLEYLRGLTALRTVLSDAHKTVVDSETLCAVMLLFYCQVRFDDQFSFFWSPHAEGVAQLIRMRHFTSGRDTFEQQLFATLHSTLLLQSIANPKIQLSACEYRKLEEGFSGAVAVAPTAHVVRHWRLLVRISELMARARRAIAAGSYLQPLADESDEIAASMETLLAEAREKLRALEEEAKEEAEQLNSSDEHPRPPLFNDRIYASHQRFYGVILASRAILLCAQRTLAPENSASHHVIAAALCEEVLRITRDSQVYRPLGSVWTVHTLICTFCAAPDDILRTRIEAELLDYQRDATGAKTDFPVDQLGVLRRRLCLLE